MAKGERDWIADPGKTTKGGSHAPHTPLRFWAGMTFSCEFAFIRSPVHVGQAFHPAGGVESLLHMVRTKNT